MLQFVRPAVRPAVRPSVWEVLKGGQPPSPQSEVLPQAPNCLLPKRNFYWVQLDMWDQNLVIGYMLVFTPKTANFIHITDKISLVTSETSPHSTRWKT